MGIPLYFKTISKKFPETIISELDTIIDNGKKNYLFFDLNCAIHPCCQKILKSHNNAQVKDNVLEKRMLTEIIDYMKILINLSSPDFIYIAIDGVAPFSKMNQQRERRYKSRLNKTIDDHILTEMGMEPSQSWDTNAISPGTKFMNSIFERIKDEIRLGNLDADSGITKKIIFSSANEPGEGEHKILDYIRESTDIAEDDNIIIYGLDADLIMLAMSSQRKHIYLLRESLLFNKVIEGKFLLLDIDYLKFGLIMTLKDHIFEYDSCYLIKDIERIIDDYIFICYFLGNDFLPHIPGVSLKDDGHALLLKIYISILVNYGDNLIDREKMRINNAFLFSFLNKLANSENELYQKFMNKRRRLRPSNCDSTDTYEQKKHILNELPITEKKNREIEAFINLGRDKFKSRYYKCCFDMESQEEIEEVCANYIRGVKWVFFYYFKGCPAWDWKYNYRHAPLISSLCDYLGKPGSNINQIKFGASKPLAPVNQLLYILPKSSSNLVPTEYQSLFNGNYFYPDQYGVDMIYKRYFWQTQPILPDMSYKQIKKMYGKVKTTAKKPDSKLEAVIVRNVVAT
jgi:5'-3' exonuclease